MDPPEGRSKNSGFVNAARLVFAAGFGSDFVAFLGFSLAANSCLTLRATCIGIDSVDLSGCVENFTPV